SVVPYLASSAAVSCDGAKAGPLVATSHVQRRPQGSPLLGITRREAGCRRRPPTQPSVCGSGGTWKGVHPSSSSCTFGDRKNEGQMSPVPWHILPLPDDAPHGAS